MSGADAVGAFDADGPDGPDGQVVPGSGSGSVDVVVIGGGVAGLVAARQLARLGHRVIVVEERATPGGFVATQELAGIRLDSGAESFATRKGTVTALVTELGLGDAIVAPNPAGAWVTWNGGAAPLPASGLLGIPGVPLADDVRRVVGWGGSLRAYLDRLMPLLRVRPEHDLGDIVRRRMGKRVLERLVAPVVSGVHSADPSVVDVRTVAPGLTQAMTTQGSLSGAVMALREQAPAGSQVQGISGGMFRLVEALEADCRYYGVEFRTGTRVTTIERISDASPASATPVALPGDPAVAPLRWTVVLAPASPDSPPVPPELSEAHEAQETVTARSVVVATGFRPALALLAGAGAGAGAGAEAGAGAGPAASLPPLSAWPEPSSVTIATLVLDEARLDAHPRGTGVLVAAGTPGVRAKALTHSSAKWAWLAEQLPAHRHVVRLSYGRREAVAADGATTPPAAESVTTVDLRTALQDASELLGVPLDESQVVAFDTALWADSLAFATVGHTMRVRQALAAVDEVPGLDAVGAWVSGTGLAATVEHARTTASGIAAELRGDRRLDR